MYSKICVVLSIARFRLIEKARQAVNYCSIVHRRNYRSGQNLCVVIFVYGDVLKMLENFVVLFCVLQGITSSVVRIDSI